MQGHTCIIWTTLSKEKSLGTTLNQEYHLFICFAALVQTAAKIPRGIHTYKIYFVNKAWNIHP